MDRRGDERGDGVIRYAPTDGLTYNPNEALYWDESALEKELLRSFELCHGCRLCFKFCQSFRTLFGAVDAHGDVRRIPAETRDRVVDECFQCKQCWTSCPYTEAAHHEFKLDFPRLLLRANAVRRRKRGIPLRERLLARPDRLGRLGTRAAGLFNALQSWRAGRRLLERFGGIHRDKLLPPFARTTFRAWARGQPAGRAAASDARLRVVLFPTCFVEYHKPEVGRAALAVLAHNGCEVALPELDCCGMPALDAGDVATAGRQARRNVARLAPWVRRGFRIAVLNPTCGLMLREEYLALLDDPHDRALAAASRDVAAAARDVCQYLHELRRDGLLREDFRSTPGGTVAYHAPCHLRVQNVGLRGRDLLRRIPGVKPRLTAECCGHDGTWAMKTEYFERALENGARAFQDMRAAEAEVWSTDCPLAALQFEQACGKKALHPIEVLERAYRADGFPSPVEAVRETAAEPAGGG